MAVFLEPRFRRGKREALSPIGRSPTDPATIGAVIMNVMSVASPSDLKVRPSSVSRFFFTSGRLARYEDLPSFGE